MTGIGTWQSLDELRASSGVPSGWISRAWTRDNKSLTYDGREYIVAHKTEGEKRLWRMAEVIDGEAHWPSAETEETAADDAWREYLRVKTFNALFAVQLKTAEDVAEYIADCAHIDHAESKIGAIPGIGAKGATEVVAWAQEVTGWVGPDDVGPDGHDDDGFFADELPIECPRCGVLFDEAPIGFYADGLVALCKSEEPVQIVKSPPSPDRGNCGCEFKIHVNDDGAYFTVPLRNATEGEVVKAEFELDTSAELESKPKQKTEPKPDPDYDDIDFGFFDSANETEVDPGEEQTEVETAPPVTAYDFWGSEEIDTIVVPREDRIHPALKHCRPVSFIPLKSGSEEWIELRSEGIGSSDAGAILGVSDFNNAFDIWSSKVGLNKNSKPWLEPYANFGHWFEPYLRSHCEQTSDVSIQDGSKLGTLRSTSWPRAQANLDGLDQYGVIEELKTSSERWESVPEGYFAQVQHQMFVTGCVEARVRQYICPVDRKHIMSLLERFKEGELKERLFKMQEDEIAAWLFDIGEVVTWIVERDDEYIERMLERQRVFWECVEQNVEPPEEDPEGTIDLSGHFNAVATVTEFARLHTAAKVYKPEIKAVDAAKKLARKAIVRAVALEGGNPKRIKIGEHKATLVQKHTTTYWSLYPGEEYDEITW